MTAPGMLRVGDTVESQYGDASVTSITLTNQRHGKEGRDVPYIHWLLVKKGWVVVDLANGHWQYGDQVSPVQKEK